MHHPATHYRGPLLGEDTRSYKLVFVGKYTCAMRKAHKYKFHAFISYSHKDNRALWGLKTPWADWLQERIENFPLPPSLVEPHGTNRQLPDALRPIFKDRDELPAASSLSAAVLKGLKESAALIVICSPNAAQSAYVNEEIRQFKLMGRGSDILAFIVAGTPNYPADECFPPALKFKIDYNGNITGEFDTQPLAADARPNADGKLAAYVKIVAGLLKVDFLSLLVDRAEKQERQRKRRRLALLATGSCLAVAALTFLMLALFNNNFQRLYVRYWKMNPTPLSIVKEGKYQHGNTFQECRNGCPEMVVIGGGEFSFGASVDDVNADANEKPPQRVTLPKKFSVSKSEITVGQWQYCVEARVCPAVFPDTRNIDLRKPITNISWSNVKTYVQWLSRQTGNTYRLLSEVEWEYVARARSDSTGHIEVTGSDIGDFAWYNENSHDPACSNNLEPSEVCPVCTKKENAWKICDMQGNAAEFVEDCYYPDLSLMPTLVKQTGAAWEEQSGRCGDRVARGSTVNGRKEQMRISFRTGYPQAEPGSTALGFRLARSMK